MKRQYMDFVPAKAKPTKASSSKPKNNIKAASVAKPAGVAQKPISTAKPQQPTRPATEAVAFASEKQAALGTIENLNTKFVNSDVPKRPLSQKSHFSNRKTGVAAIKARKISSPKTTTKVEKPVEKSKSPSEDKKVYKTPSTPFINQNKVKKRPLSKNVYTKKAVVPKEEPKGPVTIISKPEKQAHVGLIVTIILTIILGAAAGTIAFLLLPK